MGLVLTLFYFAYQSRWSAWVGQPPAQSDTAQPANSTIVPKTAAAFAGAYVVQVSAQRTEAEAQSSYRALQQKYPAVLGSREANIRRVDLGDKGGIFYRAQVGSFATSEQATAFCDNLKAAGGQCIVQRN
jgi:cell division septation protein DedD